MEDMLLMDDEDIKIIYSKKSNKDIIWYGKKYILEKSYDKAENFLKKALVKETQTAEIYNLLGVLSEFKNRIQDAQKYYRVALIFDSSCEKAIKNLERTTQFKYTIVGINL